MNFPVPWRCLLPHEVPVDPRFLSEARAVFRGKAVDFVTYNNHEILTDLPFPQIKHVQSVSIYLILSPQNPVACKVCP